MPRAGQPFQFRLEGDGSGNAARRHYVFDLWAESWRKKVAKGDVTVVRYADDLVLGFQYRTDAERFLQEFFGDGWRSVVWNSIRTRQG